MIGTLLNDRYRLDAELGRGGMGVVYRAHDTLLDRSVAVKVLSGSRLTAEGRSRLLNEARAAAQLNHPNIVTIYDAGEAPLDLTGLTDPSGLIPFIVMELVEGESLFGRGPQTLDEVLAVAREVCAALEHAHTRAIVHRDLKPENVVLSPLPSGEGPGVRVKLMDFGLARSLSSRLTAEGTIVGTVFYLAPELALGQPFDGRADLYALGVMLYELTAGRLPFTADDPLAVISQHLHAPVVPPGTYNPGIPPALDALIVRLLSKRPGDRPTAAAQVSDALERIAEELRSGATVSPLSPITALERLVLGRLMGRERELAQAKAIWHRAASGEAQFLLVSGEPGIGKTRLVREIATFAEVSGALALAGECYAEGGAPYGPVAQMIQGALEGEGKTVALPALVLADLITLVPALRARFPDVPPNPRLDPQAERQRLFESVTALCAALTANAPLLLTVEDAHWADGGSLLMLRHLARRGRAAKLPILVVLTYREVDLDEGHPLNDMLIDLNRERLATRLKLSRLGREETRDLLASMFAADIAPEFLEGIYRETEGNPFFVEEVCKALIEEGKLYREDGRWHSPDMSEIAVPQSLRVAIQSRVAKLPEPFQDSLRLAAILGREFDFATLHRASRQDEDTLVDALETAERAQLIGEVRRAGHEVYAFAHALIPAALRESVSGARRHRLHRRAAEAIESLRPDDFEALAYHYGQAGDEDRARRYYLRAADRARAVYANEDAISLYAEALALIGDEPDHDGERFDLLASRAKVYDLLARREEHRADVEAMLALAEKLNDDARRCDALIALADFYLETEFVAAREPAKRAIEIARAIGDPVREGHALRRLGYRDYMRNDLPRSRATLEEAVARFREAGQPGEAAICLHTLSLTLTSLGDLPASQKAAKEAVALSRQAGDRRQEAISLRRLAISHMEQYHPAEGLPFAEAALALHRELGDRSEECHALNVLGTMYAWLGRVDEVELALRQSLEIAEMIGSSLGVLNSVSTLVELHFRRQGQLEAGLALLSARSEKARLAGDMSLVLLHWMRASLLADFGQFALALESAQEALPIAEKHLGQGARINILSLIGRVHAEFGDYAEARRFLEAALARAEGGTENGAVPADAINPLYEMAYLARLEGERTRNTELLRDGLARIRRAAALLREVKNMTGLVYNLDYTALLHLALGENDEALAASTEALRLVEAVPYPSYLMERFFFTHSRALRAVRREAEADDYLCRAYERVMFVADKTQDESLRRGWLENVRANRDILADWAARGVK